ncbi:hypothetical protein [Botrimarina hoheduenensis]|uniref:Beta-porphyranase A n=1 Tax=Botrimarina hoheduenensis TaxID=2528000 RepID=A0A5C5VRY8_9BACT|nr:hypothetical protein [Botrimarina hoheduenensis]TWT40695.1 Beta-porphyranase A precursor [Botrimarina hoheduenensis]
MAKQPDRKCSPRRVTAFVCVLLLQAPVLAQPVTVVARPHHLNLIGGERDLSRTKYFNHWGTFVIQGPTNLGDLATQVWAEDGLNSATGRDVWITDSFVGKNAGEDPNRPGYYDLDDLRTFLRTGTNQFGQTFRSHLNTSTRYESVRRHENHVLVHSGRAESGWPSWLRDGTNLPMSHNGEAYAEFINTYFEEVVFGNGPAVGNTQSEAYLPVAPENFYYEIMNEPSWELGPGGLDWDGVIEMHRIVTERVKSQNPQAQIGGASVGNFVSAPGLILYDWDFKRRLMDDMVNWQTDSGERAEFDFWTFHPYDARGVESDGSIAHAPESSGHLDGILDLFESYSYQRLGDPKQFAITEYGTIQYTRLPGGDYSPYDRRLIQWDELTDVKKKMMTFLDRPDRIINATPYIAPQWWTGSSPTEPNGSANAFWDRNADGTWTETIAAGFYRMMNDLRGQYVHVESSDASLQTAAFRDGDKLHVVLNNLEESTRTVDVGAILGDAAVLAANLDRVFWDGSVGVFQDDLDVLGDWQSLNLSGGEAVKLTLTLDGAAAYEFATNRQTYYGDITETPINLAGSRSAAITIDADLEDALSAVVRVAISDRPGILNESFDVVVNGVSHLVAAEGVNGFDETDTSLFSREIEVPVKLLTEVGNEVYVDFGSSGGDLVTATLVVTHSVGDFNGSGAFDGEDLAMLFGEFGPADTSSRYDLDADGTVDAEDVRFWSEQLRGVATPTGDFNGDGAVDAADYTVIRDLSGTEFQFDYQHWRNRFGAVAPVSGSAGVPEPSTVVLAVLGLMAAVRQSSRGHNDR